MADDKQHFDESFPPNGSHHVGNPPTQFKNPWPSFQHTHGPLDMFKTRFINNKNFIPVPENREGLVKIRKPDWGANLDPEYRKLKATWIGHASWLIETPAPEESRGPDGEDRPKGAPKPKGGIRILCDPVFAERTSPFSFIGPKRYTPTPCSLAEISEVDIVCISHDHYDHLDIQAVRDLAARYSRPHFLCGLGLRDWFISVGVKPDRVTELDWWQVVECTVPVFGTMKIVCTPAQHFSARGIGDQGKRLWCSWAMGSIEKQSSASTSAEAEKFDKVVVKQVGTLTSFEDGDSLGFLQTPRLYFAGDTGYRTVDKPNPTLEEAREYPHCPAFTTIGKLLGPFDLALLPIGLYSPRNFMSQVHCCPEDSACVAKDLRAKRSIGMHYGTVRGGISGQYEDVLEPPRRWKQACEEAGLKWGEQAGLCDIGETIGVQASTDDE